MKIRKVAVTGTKGKTTVVNMFSEVLQRLGVDEVLSVNTDGHFINGEQRSTMKDSIAVWSMRPTVCPGRYLYEFVDTAKNQPEDGQEKEYAAVFEASLSSGTTIGVGYAVASVAVFLNVFDDHIGSSVRTNIKSRKDLAKLKSFIYTRMANNGYAVCNADDVLVVKSLKVIPKEKKTKILYFGLHQNTARLLKKKNTQGVVTVAGGNIVYVTQEGTEVVSPVSSVSWTFEGEYEPSVYNVLAITAMTIGYYDGKISKKFAQVLSEIHPDARSGRLVRFTCTKNISLIADYAHEKESLCEMASLGRKLAGKDKKVIGVVRLAHNRSDAHIKEVAKAIASSYDSLVVYDKIDGHWYTPEEDSQENKKFPKVVGRTSQVLYDAIVEYGGTAQRIVREDQALQKAYELASDGDTVIAIVGDDIDRSIECIQKSFEAEVMYTNT